jgi:hypothetical protein
MRRHYRTRSSRRSKVADARAARHACPVVGALILPRSPERRSTRGVSELAVRANAAALVGRLPLLHRDPFDPLLVAQAIVEPATLHTADRQLVGYSDLVRRIGAR